MSNKDNEKFIEKIISGAKPGVKTEAGLIAACLSEMAALTEASNAKIHGGGASAEFSLVVPTVKLFRLAKAENGRLCWDIWVDPIRFDPGTGANLLKPAVRECFTELKVVSEETAAAFAKRKAMEATGRDMAGLAKGMALAALADASEATPKNIQFYSAEQFEMARRVAEGQAGAGDEAGSPPPACRKAFAKGLSEYSRSKGLLVHLVRMEAKRRVNDFVSHAGCFEEAEFYMQSDEKDEYWMKATLPFKLATGLQAGLDGNIRESLAGTGFAGLAWKAAWRLGAKPEVLARTRADRFMANLVSRAAEVVNLVGLERLDGPILAFVEERAISESSGPASKPAAPKGL